MWIAERIKLTIKNVNVHCGRLRIIGPADVFPRIGWPSVLDQKGATRLDSLLRDDADSSSVWIVSDHLDKMSQKVVYKRMQ